MNINGKTAIITGSASGLGAATARRLHNLGANVLIADINEEKGQAISGELGDNAVFARMDVTSSQDIQSGIDLAVEKFKSMDILVNCAGLGFAMRTVGKNGPHDLDAFKSIISVNLIYESLSYSINRLFYSIYFYYIYSTPNCHNYS